MYNLFASVQKRILQNGLTVLVKPDRKVPLACLLTWVNVGYFHEPDSLCGISHFIEHMYFKGTQKRGVGDIAQETKALGGFLNASTIYDHTYYYSVFPQAGFRGVVDIQADALANPSFDSGEMEKEKEVILQEVRRKYDNPHPYAWEKLLELSFDEHRIRRWRIGTEEGIRKFSRDDVVNFYQAYYDPRNITVVAVGDLDVNEAFQVLEDAYGKIDSRNEKTSPSSPLEPVQKHPRIRRIKGDLSRSLLKMGFHSPSLLHPDYHAMTFLSTLLGRGKSSRLHRSLKEEKAIVDVVGTSLYASKDVGFLTLEAELKSERLSDCVEEFWVELDRIRKDPPSSKEVSKIRNIMETNFFAEREDVMGQAYSLAFFESLGGYEKGKDYLQAMRSVLPKDVIRVVDQYCTFSKMNLLEYVPTSVGDGASYDLRLENLQKRIAYRFEKNGQEQRIQDVPPPTPIVFQESSSMPLGGDYEKVNLMDGATVYLMPSSGVPTAAVSVFFPGGRLDETEANCGLTQFVLRSSLKGTEERTADEIAFDLESLGASLHIEATADFFGFTLNLLARNIEPGIELLAEILTQPRFSQEEIEKEKISTLAELAALRDDMFRFPIELFYQSLFGLHPYGLPRNGFEDSVRAFHRPQLLDWYQQIFRWRKMKIFVVGNFHKDTVMNALARNFSIREDRQEEPRAEIYPVLPSRGPREKVVERDRHQSGLALGFSGIPFRDERFAASEVLRNILSGMGGRLFGSLREERALAYTVTCFNIGLLRSGAFMTYMAMSPEKEAEAKLGILREMKKARETHPTQNELNAAKAFTLGTHALSMQTNVSAAYHFAQEDLVGTGVEHWKEFEERVSTVTLEGVRRVAQDIFDLDNYATGVVRGLRK